MSIHVKNKISNFFQIKVKVLKSYSVIKLYSFFISKPRCRLVKTIYSNRKLTLRSMDPTISYIILDREIIVVVL